MVAPPAAVEVPAIGPVPHVDAVVRVLRRVRVYDVHQHDEAEAVRLVDHRLELVGRAAARRGLRRVESFFEVCLFDDFLRGQVSSFFSSLKSDP